MSDAINKLATFPHPGRDSNQHHLGSDDETLILATFYGTYCEQFAKTFLHRYECHDALLAACKAIVEDMRYKPVHFDWPMWAEKWFAQLNAAIQKAETLP